MSESEVPTPHQRRNSEHTKKDASSETSKTPTKNEGSQQSRQSSASGKQPSLTEGEIEQAHEEDTAGCLCPILAKLPHFHWSKYSVLIPYILYLLNRVQERQSADWLAINLHMISGTIHERNSMNRPGKKDVLTVKVFATVPGRGDGGQAGEAIESIGWI